MFEELVETARQSAEAVLQKEREEEVQVSSWRKRVEEARDLLADEAWFRREENPDMLEHASEIRQLVGDQLSEDIYSITGNARDRIGRASTGRVVSHNPHDREQFDPFWHPLSDDQLALRETIERFMQDVLTGEERVLVRRYFDAMMSQRDIAELENISQPAVLKRLNRVYDKLRVAMLERYMPKEEGLDGEG